LHVKRGDRVQPNEVLAVLRNAPLYEAQRNRAGYEVQRAELELQQIRAGERRELVDAQKATIEANQAETTMLEGRLKRYDALLKDKHIDQDRYDELASRLASLRAVIRREQWVLESLNSGRDEEIGQAEIQVQLAQARQAEAAVEFDLQQVRAPFAGEVLEIHAWPGECVGEDGALLSLGDTAHMMVVAEVYETDLPRVHLGQGAIVRGQAFTNEITGKVVEIQRFFEGNRVFPLDPSSYVDRRIVAVRIQPDQPELLAPLSGAHVVVTLREP